MSVVHAQDPLNRCLLDSNTLHAQGTMSGVLILSALLLVALGSPILSAQPSLPSPTLVFRGQIAVAGTPFHGPGQFADLWIVKGQPVLQPAVRDAGGWPQQGSQREFVGGFSERVQQGHYTLRLAPPPEALAALPTTNPNPSGPSPVVLQVWFSDGLRGWWPIATSAVPAFARSTTAAPLSQSVSGNPPSPVSQSTSAPSTLGNRLAAPGFRRLERPPDFARERITTPERDPAQKSGGKSTNPAASRPRESGVGLWTLPEGPVEGNAQAPLALVAFLDVDCVHCRRWFTSVYPRLEEQWIRTGKLRVIFQLRPPPGRAGSESEAQALLCAQLQGQFLPALRARMSGSSKDSGPIAWKQLGSDLRLDSNAWDACLKSMQTFPTLQQHLRAGIAAEVTATPTFFLGRVEGAQLKGFRLDGNQSLAEFERRINRLREDVGDVVTAPSPP